MTDPLGNSIKLIVATGSFAAKPGLLPGLKSGLTVRDTLTAMMRSPPPGVSALATDLTTSARQVLSGFARDLRPDAEVLYEQMIITTLPDPAEIVEGAMNAQTICASMRAKLTDPEHLRPPMPDLFDALTKSTLNRLLADKSFAEDLTPAYMAGCLATLHRIDETTQEGLAEILARLGGLEALIAKPEGVTLGELKRIARQFGETKLRAKSTLLEFLTKKAEEYLAYKAEIDAIDERTKGLGNLKAAAQDAANRLDFEEVEKLLSMVHETEVEIAAQTAELRADNALMRGRVDQAFQLLSGAADSFGQIDTVQPGTKRINYADKLYRHGLRYGGSGLARATEMWRRASETVARDAHPIGWAMAQNNLASALANQGVRVGGGAGADLLTQAITAYRAVLEIHTFDRFPSDWAKTQNNLAIALAEQGNRNSGAEGARLLAQAVAAYRAALEVHTREAHPMSWATTQNNLANALTDRCTHSDRDESIDLLNQAIAAYRAALEVRTRDAHPMDWARTQMNLATALADQGTRTGGTAGADFLAQAVTAYCAVLAVSTRDAHPLQWAMTQENLGLAFERLSKIEEARAKTHLRKAISCLDHALEVFKPENMPYDHSTATKARTRIAAALAAL